ncbi:MAG: hypothetical protein WA021_03010 [Minisyncoccia bacterium]
MEASDELAILLKKESEQRGEPMSDAEAVEAAANLTGFFKLLAELAWKDAKKKARLRKEPVGFAVDGHYSCLVCGNSIDETTGWYHHGGQRCLLCHKAILEGVIPLFVLHDHDSYYKMWKLKDFGVHSATARKMIKDGRLKARIVLNEQGKPHEYIFLKKENPELAACEKWNPIYKSQKRNRDKRYTTLAKKERAELRFKRGV